MSLASRAASSRNFKKVQNFKTDYAPTTITQYESTKTGMRIVVVDQEGPKVNGYFTLATEIHDDSGAPHTLEHLCFMGSKNFRYKGVLDRLATRAYSNTNAWTATDHTAYTLDTAGWEGFAQILPIYLEHVIVPTLTDAACYTEVHHIDAEGNDAGVVYSEMQGVQNTQSELLDLRHKRLMYPKGVGFRYETGGMLEQLRILTADRIRAFHKEMYQPKNLCVILVGAVEHQDLLDTLDRFESSIHDDVPQIDAPFKRPWIDSKQTPLLEKSTLEIVDFPEEDETAGEIVVSFFGPSYANNVECAALFVLLRYLAGSSASVLDNTIVEKEHLASGVYYYTEFRPTVVIHFQLGSVATEILEDVEKRLLELLRDTASKPLDMKFMQECVQVERAQVKFQAETSSQFFSEPVIRDFLFGKRDGSTLREDLETMKEYDAIDKWDDEQWRQLIKSWFSENHHVSLLGKPSIQLSEKLKSEEKARVETQKKHLGEDGLKKLAAKLDEAKEENNREIPRSLLEGYKVPDPTLIRFIKTTTARSGAAKQLGLPSNEIQKLVDGVEHGLPLFIQFEHVRSNFALLNIVIGTENIPTHLRPLLDIYTENFFSTPIMRDGQQVEFEQVVMELERDTVGYALSSGSSLGNSETLKLTFQVEVEKYELAISRIKEMIFYSIFDIERLESTLTRLLAEIPEEKRSGSDMASSVDNMIKMAPASITRAGNILTRALYLKLVKKLLKQNPDALLSQFEQIRKTLFQPSNFRVLVIADVTKLQNPVLGWKALVGDLDNSKPLNPLETQYSRLNDLGRKPADIAYIVPMPTVDSSFLIADAKGPNSHFDEAVPTLMVALSYLNAVEGPLWNAVRGTGLAYGTTLRHSIEKGQVTLDVYRSPDPFKAFNASRKVVEDFVTDTTEFDSLTLEGAISSIVASFANSEATMAAAAQISFVRQVVRGQPKDWPTILLEKVRSVTFEQMQKVMRDVLLPIFKAESSIVVITCAPIMQEGLVKDLEGIGYKPQVKPLAFFQDDYGFGAEFGLSDTEGEDDDDEEDESEDEVEEDAVSGGVEEKGGEL